MHVGLNLVFLVPGETGGMETYARELLPRLAARPDLTLTSFVNRECAGEDLGGGRQVVVPVDATDRKQWVWGEQRHLPRLAAAAGCDVVHSLASTAPLWGSFARVTTIHDLHYKTVPDAHFGLRARGMALLVPAAARRSHRVLVDSETVRGELLHHLGLPAGKIDVAPLGVAPRVGVVATPETELRARFGLGDRAVVLTTGGTRPHKNVRRLVEAMRGLDAVLVVTGYATPEDDALVALGAPGQIVRTGLVPAADLEGLYALASVVCAPSLSEGFGLPVLEAMLRGAPVACSAGGALGEVAGDAALTFDPARVEDIRGAVGRLLDDGALRDRLVAAGRARAATFTWERTAELTAASYARALS